MKVRRSGKKRRRGELKKRRSILKSRINTMKSRRRKKITGGREMKRRGSKKMMIKRSGKKRN